MTGEMTEEKTNKTSEKKKNFQLWRKIDSFGKLPGIRDK